MKPTPIESIVAAQAALLELPIAAEHRPGVVAYFALASDMARLVVGLPLGTHDESGSVFLPVVPSESA
jgi:hypothetical protein